MKKTAFSRTILSQAIRLTLCAGILAPFAVHASEADLLVKIDKLAAELDSLRTELNATRKKADAVAKAQENVGGNGTGNNAASHQAKTVISGYGEVNYTRPRNNGDQAQADVRRAVFGIAHRFDDKTKLVSEFEYEHAVVSADDSGEAEVEQLYVEHELGTGLRAKAGLFLIPAGLINTNHEPTAYYGVERNFVETAIIPSTWREAGFGLSANLDNGWSFDGGLTTGFDLSKWDATSGDGVESPLGSIHQEGQLAKSRNLSLHAAANWRGVPGLLLGGSIFTGKAGHETENFNANDARVTLWDLHARYTPGAWDLSALYTRGTISNAAAFNVANAGSSTPVPASFFGWYGQAAYHVWKNNDYRLTPFVRYEQFNTAHSYDGQVTGVSVTPAETEKVFTVGANFNIGEGVVLKADYQKFNVDSNRDRYNLGVGYAF
jgi:hypothetical protein